MGEEIFAGIILCVMGLCMILVPSKKLWSVTDKWKTKGGEGPSKSFVVITRVLGIVFLVAGGCLFVCGLL